MQSLRMEDVQGQHHQHHQDKSRETINRSAKKTMQETNLKKKGEKISQYKAFLEIEGGLLQVCNHWGRSSGKGELKQREGIAGGSSL